MFVRKERRGIVSDRGIEGPPDLVVEILSPSTAERDRGLKRERCAHFGVPEYWIVDPDERVIERWRFGDAAQAPEVAREILVWRPVAGDPVLEIPVHEVTAPLDE